MRPQRIILIRHGQSQGNLDKSIYTSIPDYAMDLTPLGFQQADNTGENLKNLLEEKAKVKFFYSPMWRARRTYERVAKKLDLPHTVYEDARLREQDWGHLKVNDNSQEEERDAYGHFYYRLPDGESCADVYDRISDFLNTLHREFEKTDFPENAVIVSHGMAIRLFIMRWFHLTVEEFELLANPKNGEMVVLERKPDSKYFELKTPFRHHTLKHTFQYKWESKA
jgi:broad specificity phosphatase PhoE